MKHVTITICKYEELSETAQETARDLYRQTGFAWGWQDEWWQSAQEFSRIAPIVIVSADHDRGHVDARWRGDSDVADLSGLRAWKWLQNNGWFDLAAKNAQGGCTLTGYCGDCPLFDPIAAYAKTPLAVPDLAQVFYECAQAWIYAAQADCEWCHSDEAVAESIICNEYEFTEDGEFWA